MLASGYDEMAELVGQTFKGYYSLWQQLGTGKVNTSFEEEIIFEYEVSELDDFILSKIPMDLAWMICLAHFLLRSEQEKMR